MLTAQRASAEKLDREIDDLERQVDALRDEEDALAVEYRLNSGDVSALVMLNASEDRALRDQIESLFADEAKCEHAVDLAQDNFATSKAAYEALLETEDEGAALERARRQRSVQVGLSLALPLVFVLAGVPLFVHGRELTSLVHRVGRGPSRVRGHVGACGTGHAVPPRQGGRRERGAQAGRPLGDAAGQEEARSMP